MNETYRTYPNLEAKIQVYISNKTQTSNYFSLLRKSGSYKNMLNFMAIVYILPSISCYMHISVARLSELTSLALFFYTDLSKCLLCPLVVHYVSYSLYTQKKKFSQYLCFLIKSTILHISLSNFVHELYYRNFTRTCYCVLNNAFIRLYQPNSKCTMCTCCGKPAGLFSHILFDIERDLFPMQ